VDQLDAQAGAGAQQPGVDERAAVIDVVPTSAQRRLCRPGDYADLGVNFLFGGAGAAEVSA
jgi:hypothetical protein